MIDSNAIANLQMLMNTGDGRQAVLAELLQADKLAQSSIGATKDFSTNESTRHAISQGDAATVAIQGPRDHCIKLLATSPAATKNHFRLTERIIQQLDRLPKEDKESLITFAEGLAYNYNNQFMAIVGYISIVMFRLHPEHPSYGQLRECEELIHNSALLIRLLVDVFNRSFHAPKTAYPIDLTDIEIGDRIFPNINKQSSSSTIADKELNLQKILKIVASAMAKRMHRIFNLLQSQIGRIFSKQYLGTLYGEHYRQIELHLKRGMNIADALLDFATTKSVEKLPIDLKSVVSETIAMYSECFSGLQIKMECPSGSVVVHGNARLLKKMLLELLANSNDACPIDGQVRLKILKEHNAVHPDLPSTSIKFRKTHLIIEDSGPGLPACLGIRAFNPFTRSPEGRRRRGLGLAVVVGIVRAHGGHIKFFNRQNSGLVLVITFADELVSKKEKRLFLSTDLSIK